MNHGSPSFMLLSWLMLCCLTAFSSAARSKNCIGEPGAVPGIPSGFTLGDQGSGNRVLFPDANGTISYGSRTGLLQLPKTYNQSEALSKLSDPTINPDMLVIYSDAIENEWQGDPAATTDDVGLAINVIAYVKSTFCIDTDRIYATGMGNGGGFVSNILACDPASKQLAAVAGVSGAYYAQKFAGGTCMPATVPLYCNPGRRPLPMLEIHGTIDALAPYGGSPMRSECLPSLGHFIDVWSGWNLVNYGITPTSSLFNGSVSKYAFGSGDAAGLTTHYKVEGMGSAWPGVANGNYFDAAPVIMEFFKNCTKLNHIKHLYQNDKLEQDRLPNHLNPFKFIDIRKCIDHNLDQIQLPIHQHINIKLHFLFFLTYSDQHLSLRRWPERRFQRHDLPDLMRRKHTQWRVCIDRQLGEDGLPDVHCAVCGRCEVRARGDGQSCMGTFVSEEIWAAESVSRSGGPFPQVAIKGGQG
ncbi:hypothetical protein LTR95_004966 [Oleoguttula sp. CCFEE 5521]